jgi:hypothetical protein
MGDNTEDRTVHAAAVQVSVSFSLKFSISNLRKIQFATGHQFRKSGTVSALKCYHDRTVHRGCRM